ncbi:MAG TPA: transposase [Acidobacteriota bacterium]|nr:transposase [Acidobacteriota bacterium]
MARSLRIQYPGAFYHVMNRGNNRQDIFIEENDRIIFLEGLVDSCEIYGVRIIAYVLMSNHFHIIIKTDQGNLSEFMRHFLVTYSVRFNRSRLRTGHVFHGRYKSLLVQEDEYLLPLSRYIHLNPLRTGKLLSEPYKTKIKYLKNYKWSSLPGYCFIGKRVKNIDYSWLLDAYFGGDTLKGRSRYFEYVSAAIDGNIQNPFQDVIHQTILGTSDFVDRIKEKVPWGREREVPAIRNLRRSLPVDKILEVIATDHGVDSWEIISRRSKAKTIRQMAIELCYRYSPMNQKEIGDLFGIDYSTVSQNRSRLKAKLKSNEKLAEQFEKIEQKVGLLSNQKI